MLTRGDVRNAYSKWATPVTIISDGAYGVRGFHGDTVDWRGLPEWYRPHVEAWSAAATPATTLWFWNTEVGWAAVHPVLDELGWDYIQTITWDKGIPHVAGNVNGDDPAVPDGHRGLLVLPAPLRDQHARRPHGREAVAALRVAASWLTAHQGQRGLRRAQRRDQEVFAADDKGARRTYPLLQAGAA